MNERFQEAIRNIEAAEHLAPAGSHEHSEYVKAALLNNWRVIRAYAEWERRQAPPEPNL